MRQVNHLGRWIAACVGALALFGAGTAAAATTPPSEPPGDSTAGSGASDCPTIPAVTEASAPGTAAAGPATSEVPAAGTQPTGADAATTPFLQIAQSEEFGEILVDSQCRALYALTRDVDGEPTCVNEGDVDDAEDCTRTWPPLIVEDPTATFFPDYLDPELLSGVDHPDHPEGMQVKFGDWPLYYFAQDRAPGDLKGQGLGGVWWLVAPDGTLIEGGTGATATSAPTGSMPTDTAATDTAVATTGG
jgi:predicted lipoprotein with Yx(FWY)xxD motif